MELDLTTRGALAQPRLPRVLLAEGANLCSASLLRGFVPVRVALAPAARRLRILLELSLAMGQIILAVVLALLRLFLFL